MDSHAIFILSCSCYNLVRNMDAYMTLVVQRPLFLFPRALFKTNFLLNAIIVIVIIYLYLILTPL